MISLLISSYFDLQMDHFEMLTFDPYIHLILVIIWLLNSIDGGLRSDKRQKKSVCITSTFNLSILKQIFAIKLECTLLHCFAQYFIF